MSKSSSPDLPAQMRAGMRRLASGVCVVTARDNDGNRLAMTASSVTSLSDNPVSLLVCIHTSSYLDAAIRDSGVFCVNVLSRDQEDISVRCALPDTKLDRFAIGEWEQDENSQLYYLKDALSVFHCKHTTDLEHGTHRIFVGNIDSVRIAGDDIDPLVYLDGEYVSIA